MHSPALYYVCLGGKGGLPQVFPSLEGGSVCNLQTRIVAPLMIRPLYIACNHRILCDLGEFKLTIPQRYFICDMIFDKYHSFIKNQYICDTNPLIFETNCFLVCPLKRGMFHEPYTILYHYIVSIYTSDG